MQLKSFTARCYCGEVRLAGGPIETAAICHCDDCKRWTGAPMPAFLAVKTGSLFGLPGAPKQINAGVNRWNCIRCGSPVAATFDYLPDQIYVPLGIVDQAADIHPEVHCHFDNALSWLHLDDGLPREGASARAILNRS